MPSITSNNVCYFTLDRREILIITSPGIVVIPVKSPFCGAPPPRLLAGSFLLLSHHWDAGHKLASCLLPTFAYESLTTWERTSVSQPAQWAGKGGGFALRTFHPDRVGTTKLHQPRVPPYLHTDGVRDGQERVIRTSGSTAPILPSGAQQKGLQRIGNSSAKLQRCHLLATIKHGATNLFKTQPQHQAMCEGGGDQLLRAVNTHSDHHEKALQGAAVPVSMPN